MPRRWHSSIISRLLTMLSSTSLPKWRRQSRARSSRLIRLVFTVATTTGIESSERLRALGDRAGGSDSRASAASSDDRDGRTERLEPVSDRADGLAWAGDVPQ